MEWWDWLGIGLGTVQAIATVGALYYAWKTVKQAGETEKDFRRDRLSSRLGQLTDAVVDLDLWARNSNQQRAKHAQARARVLLVGTQPLSLPLTKELAEVKLDTLEELIAAYTLAMRAQDEIRDASEHIT